MQHRVVVRSVEHNWRACRVARRTCVDADKCVLAKPDATDVAASVVIVVVARDEEIYDASTTMRHTLAVLESCVSSV